MLNCDLSPNEISWIGLSCPYLWRGSRVRAWLVVLRSGNNTQAEANLFQSAPKDTREREHGMGGGKSTEPREEEGV
jgi:hypothetical protein